MLNSCVSIIISIALLLGAGAPAVAADIDTLSPGTVEQVAQTRTLAVQYAVCAALPLIAVSALLGKDLADAAAGRDSDDPAPAPRPSDDRGTSQGLTLEGSSNQGHTPCFSPDGIAAGRWSCRSVSIRNVSGLFRPGATVAIRLSPCRLARGAIDAGVQLPGAMTCTL
jgi:hypothetical protein